MRTIKLTKNRDGTRSVQLLCAVASEAFGGAALADFPDPERGRLRRHKARDRFASRLPHAAERQFRPPSDRPVVRLVSGAGAR